MSLPDGSTPLDSARPRTIRPRERDAILHSLRAGVVPRTGFQHFQVGREPELRALTEALDGVADGGSMIRFVIGDFGAGKTFFLNLIRAIAVRRRLVTATADAAADKRLRSSSGQSRALYQALMAGLATNASPEGGALTAVIERFVTAARAQAAEHSVSPDVVIDQSLARLAEFTGGYDFGQVVKRYWNAYDGGDEDTKANALRWLRGEYTSKRDALADLGVRTIVDDANYYGMLKLVAQFVRLAGFKGLVVCLDEMVGIYRLADKRARQANYEQILAIVNDCLQGGVQGLGVVFSGTVDFLVNDARGLYSYPALRGRLEENRFAAGGLVDLSGPVLRLQHLTPEHLRVLLELLRNVHASYDPARYRVPDSALDAFLTHCRNQIGDDYFRTPRNTIRQFLDLLAILDQNPAVDWQDLLVDVAIAPEYDADPATWQDDASDGVSLSSDGSTDFWNDRDDATRITF